MRRLLAILAATFSLTACATEPPTVSRGDTMLWAPGMVKVSVPTRLRVADGNGYLPAADIVWQEDLTGDPRQQVGRIVEAGAQRAMGRLTGVRPVVMAVEVEEFHALTRRARYAAPFGRHRIRLNVQVFDVVTGRSVAPQAVLDASFAAYTRDQAIAAERRGITQRVRIAAHIEEVLAEWMGVGGG